MTTANWGNAATRAGQKARREKAQDMLMDGISLVLGYWEDKDRELAESMTPQQRAAFREVLQQQADRIARLFNYDKAWSA